MRRCYKVKLLNNGCVSFSRAFEYDVILRLSFTSRSTAILLCKILGSCFELTLN